MEKYRQSRRFVSFVIFSYFCLSCFFSFFCVGVSYKDSVFSMPSLQKNMICAEKIMDFAQRNEKFSGKYVYDVVKNMIKNPAIKRGSCKDWRLLFWVALNTIALLLVFLVQRYCDKKMLSWYRWELIRYIQNTDGKKRQWRKEDCMAV